MLIMIFEYLIHNGLQCTSPTGTWSGSLPLAGIVPSASFASRMVGGSRQESYGPG